MQGPSKFHKSDWKIKQHLANIIVESGGEVFGGFVRDSILHDYYAKEYYKKCKENDISPEKTEQEYNNEEFYPESKDRMVIPSDIDCYITGVANLAQFESKLSMNKYSYNRLFTRTNASKYLKRLTVPENSLIHIRYKVYCMDSGKKHIFKQFITKNLPEYFQHSVKNMINGFLENLLHESMYGPEVFIDVLVNKTEDILEPPFGNLDFECNGLILGKNGIRLTESLSNSVNMFYNTTKLHQIMRDILQRNAVIVKTNKVDGYRIYKMQKKNWNIITNYTHIREVRDNSKEETCIICHEDLEERDHYKLTCCQARYHKQCLLDCATKGTMALQVSHKCIMCKKPLHYILEDIGIFENI